MKGLSKEQREDYYGEEKEYYDGFLTDAAAHAATLMEHIQEDLDKETLADIKRARRNAKELVALIEDEIMTLKQYLKENNNEHN